MARGTTGSRKVWIGGAAAVVVLAVLAVVSVTAGSGGGASGGRNAQVGKPADARMSDPVAKDRLAAPRRTPGDPLARGRVDAPVVIAEWGDFQCPFCREYTSDTEPALLRKYVETGTVRIEWHDYAYLGPESTLAARAARAAGRQGRFWPFHDALYRNQGRENSGAINARSLTATARRLGLDVPRFRRDYADPAVAATVAADRRHGSRLGVGGVPSFVVGDQLLFGPQQLPAFGKAIDAARADRR